MNETTLSERALVLAPHGRDSTIAAAMLAEAGIAADIRRSAAALIGELDAGAGFVLVTEEALADADLRPLADWLARQEEWSDLPFVLLTRRGGGLERNPRAGRFLDLLGNVTFVERPFHPTTLVSLARSALRGRRRQYEARARLRALHESERQFRSLANSIPTLCWMAEPDGSIFWYNRRWYEYTGTSPEEMAGWGWQSVHHPDFLEEVTREWRRSIAEGTPFEMVFPLRSASGEFRSFLTRIEPVRDAEGAITRWFGTNTDISDQLRAEAELKALNDQLAERIGHAVADREAALAQLHEAQKLETLGHLTGGVAHDFNNLLTPITGTLDLLYRRRANDDARTARLLGGALQSAERAKTLVQRLLGFARRQVLQNRPVDLFALVASMRDLIESSVGRGIEVRIAPAEDLPPAMADPNQLELAILNLCVNARDAMPGGGMLTISIDRADYAGEAPGRLPPGAYLRLSVIDTGTGMDEETLARAIEPFYSTKEVGKGTGLGLSMVHGLAAQLGGTFALASAVGEGTRADLYLPAAETAAASVGLPEPAGPVVRGGARSILLVDDEDVVRSGTAEMLRDLGHQVAEATGGANALLQLGTGLKVDAVITDYMMPQMDGAELARRIRAEHPGLPVLVITGYAGGDLNLGLPQLAKPFRQADIALALQRLFAEPEAAQTAPGH